MRTAMENRLFQRRCMWGRKLVGSLIVPLTVSLVSFAQQSSYSVSGKVLDDKGDAVDNALVIISTVSAEKTGAKTPVPISAATDNKGTLTLAGVVPGTYNICVLAKNNLLNPCEWSPATSRFTVVSGKTPAPLTITLVTGTTAHIHIQDSDSVVYTPFQQSQTNTVLAASVIDGQGYRHPAHYTSTNGNTHTFDLRIPFDIDLKL